MPKTALLLVARERLRALGDQLHYSALADEQFGLTIAAPPTSKRNAFTPEVFPKSRKAPRINVRVSELAKFRKATVQTGYGAAVIASYQVLESYALELPDFLSRLGRHKLVFPQSQYPEELLAATLRASGQVGFDEELIDTFKYCRLRRNQIVHVSEEPRKELARLVRQRGTRLMRYWNQGGALDFAAPPLPVVGEHEAIDLLNFIRILVEEFDPLAAAFLDTRRVVMFLNKFVIHAQPHTRGKAHRLRRSRKIAGMAAMYYDIQLRPADISQLLWP